MRYRWSSSLAFAAVVCLATGCVATTGDLDLLKQELQRTIAEKTAPIEPLKADTKSKFDSVDSDMNKIASSLAELQGRVKELNEKSELLVRERDKIQLFVQSANRRIVSLFKSEESVLKDRMDFLRSIVKEFEADELKKEDAPPKGGVPPTSPRK